MKIIVITSIGFLGISLVNGDKRGEDFFETVIKDNFFNNITTINENSTVENINKYLSLHIYYEDSRNLINFIHFFNVCWTTIVENNALMGFILKKNEQPFLSEA